MSCELYREAISAELDGEALGMAKSMLDGHLSSCPACRAWAAAARDLARTATVVPIGVTSDQSGSIVAAAIDHGIFGPSSARDAERRWRWMLVAIALTQLTVAVTHLADSDFAAPTHLGHELGAGDLALGLGFLFAAWRPGRAWGMLPLVAAVVGCLIVATAVDVLGGQTDVARESAHFFEVAGLVVLWLLARRPGGLRSRSRAGALVG